MSEVEKICAWFNISNNVMHHRCFLLVAVGPSLRTSPSNEHSCYLLSWTISHKSFPETSHFQSSFFKRILITSSASSSSEKEVEETMNFKRVFLALTLLTRILWGPGFRMNGFLSGRNLFGWLLFLTPFFRNTAHITLFIGKILFITFVAFSRQSYECYLFSK